MALPGRTGAKQTGETRAGLKWGPLAILLFWLVIMGML